MTAAVVNELPPVRDQLVGKTPYGAPQLDVRVRLNTNENPFGPDPRLVSDLARAVGDIAGDANRYPDRDAVELRGALANYLYSTTGISLQVDQVWAANGSNEVLQQLLMAYAGPGRVVLGFEPSYSMHRTLAESTGAEYVASPRAEDFSIDVDAALAAINEHHPSVIFLCTPNNPTGGSLDADTILRIHDASTALIVLDEAYVEFSHSPSTLPLIAGRPSLWSPGRCPRRSVSRARASDIWPQTLGLWTRSSWCACRTTCPPSPKQLRSPRYDTRTASCP